MRIRPRRHGSTNAYGVGCRCGPCRQAAALAWRRGRGRDLTIPYRPLKPPEPPIDLDATYAYTRPDLTDTEVAELRDRVEQAARPWLLLLGAILTAELVA